jgi:hypothetical protein
VKEIQRTKRISSLVFILEGFRAVKVLRLTVIKKQKPPFGRSGLYH